MSASQHLSDYLLSGCFDFEVLVQLDWMLFVAGIFSVQYASVRIGYCNFADIFTTSSGSFLNIIILKFLLYFL